MSAEEEDEAENQKRHGRLRRDVAKLFRFIAVIRFIASVILMRHPTVATYPQEVAPPVLTQGRPLCHIPGRNETRHSSSSTGRARCRVPGRNEI